MLRDATILIDLLNSVELRDTENSDIMIKQLIKLKEFINLPLYKLYAQLRMEMKPAEVADIANAVLYKASTLYGLKEYRRSFRLILVNIFNFNPINLDIIKLVIANFYSLNFLELSGILYSRLFQGVADPECLYFSGLSYYFLQERSRALPYLEQFNAIVANSVRYQKELADLTKISGKLIAQMRQDTSISS